MEKFFILDGVDCQKYKEESKLTEFLQKSLSAHWNQHIQIISLRRDVFPEDIGLDTSEKRYLLLRVRGEDTQSMKSITKEGASFTLMELPLQIVLDCEVKLDKKYIEVIPELAKIITELIASTGVAILEDDQNEYWLKGNWFQVAISKRILMSSYISNCKAIDFKAREGVATKLLSMILAGNVYTEKSSKGSLKYTYVRSLTVDLALCCLTMGLRYNDIFDGRHIAVQLKNIENSVEEVTIMIAASVQITADDGMAAFTKNLNNVNKYYKTFHLPQYLPIDYKKLLNEIIDSKFKPDLTIFKGNGKHFIYALKCSDKDALENFVTRHMECAVPSPSCGMNVLKNIAKPYHMKSEKEADSQVSIKQAVQHKQRTVEAKLTNNKSQEEIVGLFVAPSFHMNYLSSSYKETFECLAKDHHLKLEFSNDNEQINIMGTDLSSVEKVLKKILTFYHSLNLISKDLPYGMVENTPSEPKLLILHCSETTTVTGPKSLVEKLESKFHPGVNRLHDTMNTESYQKSIADLSNQNGNSLHILEKGHDNQPKQTEKKKTGARRNRQLISSDIAENLQTPTSPVIERSLSFSPVLSEGSSVYRHNPSGVYVEVGVADITKLKVDVIVNAANGKLRHEGGVAYAIAKAAGPTLDSECRSIVAGGNYLQTSETCKTSAGNLPCKYVIHAVGPMWHEYKRKETCLDVLKETFQRCLEDAAFNELTTIAIPALCSGIYGVPKESVASMGCLAVSDFLYNNPKSSLQIICLTDRNATMINLFNTEFTNLSRKEHFTLISTNGSAV